MKRLIVLLLSLCLLAADALCQPLPPTLRGADLSEEAFVSLLTVGPGDEFYTSFGHTAIRICDPANDFDWVYNYGVFDFASSGFYLKFARGDMQYWLEREDFGMFLFEYQWEKRAVWEQQINISHQELSQLLDALTENEQFDNRYYAYDFFRDNCATRAMEMIERYLDCPVHTNYIPDSTTTYRQLVHQYTGGKMRWWRLGIDILLGARCDRPISAREYDFVPIQLMYQYDTILYSGTPEPLCESTRQLLFDRRPARSAGISPTLIFWLLFAVVSMLSFLALSKDWSLRLLDLLLFSICGLISLLLLYLWFGSMHYCTKWNFNLLWASPLWLILIFRLRKPNVVLGISLLCCLLLTLVLWCLPFCSFNSAILPIVLILMERLLFLRYANMKRNYK